jgi:hypothetical protein
MAKTDWERVFRMSFASIYPHYLAKVEKKGHSKAELNKVISWLTGYSDSDLEAIIVNKIDLRGFFDNAPSLNPNASKITGVICGYRVEEIEDPLEQKIRYMDKLVDEIAKGKKMESILRS